MAEGASQASLVEALAQPNFYPHCPPSVEIRQTHISWVFLAGNFVYKLKKPVRFRFLDYSRREQRLESCLAEVRLNRRLAPAVYLGVVAVRRSDGGFALGSVDELGGEAEDYLVAMRRLPEEEMLDRRLAQGTAGAAELDRVAAKLVAFHAACPDRGEAYGSREVIAETVLGNLAECESVIGDGRFASRVLDLRRYLEAFLEKHGELLWRRASGGKIRDGHGDLRAEHICLNAALDIFDCVEFSERLRSTDVTSEVAFLAMDLDFLGFPGLAEGFARAYAEASGDRELHTLLEFYRCHRALVRAKVEILRSREPEVGAAAREEARQAARRYFRLAARYARGRRPPELVVVCGLSGTGKSTVAQVVGDLSGFAILNSDLTRKRLARVPLFQHSDPQSARSLYAADSTRRTYAALFEGARESLAAGRGVVLDATFLDPADRREALAVARAANVPVTFFECRAREEEVLRRLRDRQKRPDEVSDATEEIYLRQRAEATPITVSAPARHRIIDTARDRDEVAADVERELGADS
ncbi:MAG TPA: AAA family ATPase [Candidatus Binatia bacterium]|nr:AAA family ATPase [Candidatus Binatia bacterium]